MNQNKSIERYKSIFKKTLIFIHCENIDEKLTKYSDRLCKMYSSDKFKEHNIYPTTDAEYIYAVIAMCLELKTLGLSDNEIIEAINQGFKRRRTFFKKIIRCIDLLPNSFTIAKRWNISDYEKRVKDGSITYDYFKVEKDKVEYKISKCMYVEMFEYFVIRSLCMIFCMTDEIAYSGLTRHVCFIRYSDLSSGSSCHDEVIRKKRNR